MRTKALLCAAGLLAAGVASSMAQGNVYSLNVVGYVNVTCNRTNNLVNTPLVPSDASITNLLDAFCPKKTTVYTFTSDSFHTFSKDPFSGTWTGGGVAQLPNGSGYFIKNPNADPTNNPIVVTYVGEVPQGAVNNTLLTTGSKYTLVGDKVPQSGFLTDLGVVAFKKDKVLRFANNGFITYIKDPFTGNWSGAGADVAKGPPIAVGEGFFYQNNSGTATWNQNFTVQ